MFVASLEATCGSVIVNQWTEISLPRQSQSFMLLLKTMLKKLDKKHNTQNSTAFIYFCLTLTIQVSLVPTLTLASDGNGTDEIAITKTAPWQQTDRGVSALNWPVMQNADLISPFMRGFSHFSFWYLLPYMWITSMLPVSERTIKLKEHLRWKRIRQGWQLQSWVHWRKH